MDLEPPVKHRPSLFRMLQNRHPCFSCLEAKSRSKRLNAQNCTEFNPNVHKNTFQIVTT